MQKIELEIKDGNKNSSNNFVAPNVVKKVYSRESYSLGQLDDMIRKSGGRMLRLWGNFTNWHVIVQY